MELLWKGGMLVIVEVAFGWTWEEGGGEIERGGGGW